MIPSYAAWAQTIHAWHEGLCYFNKAEEGIPKVVELCIAWIHHNSVLPPVCFIDASSRELH